MHAPTVIHYRVSCFCRGRFETDPYIGHRGGVTQCPDTHTCDTDRTLLGRDGIKYNNGGCISRDVCNTPGLFMHHMFHVKHGVSGMRAGRDA